VVVLLHEHQGPGLAFFTLQQVMYICILCIFSLCSIAGLLDQKFLQHLL